MLPASNALGSETELMRGNPGDRVWDTQGDRSFTRADTQGIPI